VSRRVLLLITDLEIGGTPTVVRELAIRLCRSSRDIKIEVACLSRWGPVADQLRDAGIAVTALGARGFADTPIVLWKLIRFIRRGKFETVFSFLLHANAMAAAASLRLRDIRWIQSIQTTQQNPKWHWPLQRLAQHAAESVVVPSPSVARAAADWAGVPEEKIIVIPNAIDLADFADAVSAIPADDPRPYPITFLGRLDPIKDVPTLIEAIAILQKSDGSRTVLKPEPATGSGQDGPALAVHLDIYGDGKDRSRIEQAIARTGLQKSVTLHGAIDRPQEVLKQSGLLVLPSLAEGFGLVLIEAMAAGVPVIATDVLGIRDVVRHAQTGLLVPPSDPTAMAAAVERIVLDRELRKNLVTAAQSELRERFSWDAVLEQYCSVLRL
jgi:glycosyltransferase involved in cell wall biosynthesis